MNNTTTASMISMVPEEYRSRVIKEQSWQEIVAWVSDLPPLPQVASQAIALIEDPDTTAGKLTSLLGQDTALAARVLKIANSAMFSCQREITTLNQAIMLIGFKSLKGIIVAATLRQLNRKLGKIEKIIWENSTCTAMTAHLIAQHLKKHYIDEVFLLGLLHDLGKLVLARQIPKEYETVLDHTKQGCQFFEVELETLGFAHPLIGALVAKKWNFPRETCQVILHHHDILPEQLSNELDEKTAIIQAADFIAHRLGYGHINGYPDLILETTQAMNRLGIGTDETGKLTEQAKKNYEAQSAAFME